MCFRGLEGKRNMAQLQQALRGHESDPLSESMRDILEQAREEYRVKNDEALEERWQMKLSNEQKFEEDPKRYLAETFKEGKKSKNIVMLKTKRPWRIEKAAEEQSLECEYTTAPPDLEKALEDSSDDEDEEDNDCICPHIEEGWNAKNLTLKIFREDSQMWAKFNFGAITRVFRFERHDDEPAKPRISKKSRDDDSDEKCSDEEDEEGEDEEESEDEDDFHLGKISQPSKKYPTWNY
ncbi:uncharacterized protein PAC_12937 [Phialocephala subalpina]|uniref:Uncharacterized protein n=1 Tax=Phialocephala subalpina TaxID=576137 RepID=A0A1L7XDC2_9HELO|nr:uncharacterized protein PAC_12937 [Phialocephala subalpina]